MLQTRGEVEHGILSFVQEQPFGIQFAVRIVNVQHAVESVFLEITGDENILVLVALVFELVYIRFDIARKRSVDRTVRVQRNVQFGCPIRVALWKKFVQMQSGGREMAFQVGGNVLLFVAPEYQVCLDGSDR